MQNNIFNEHNLHADDVLMTFLVDMRDLCRASCIRDTNNMALNCLQQNEMVMCESVRQVDRQQKSHRIFQVIFGKKKRVNNINEVKNEECIYGC